MKRFSIIVKQCEQMLAWDIKGGGDFRYRYSSYQEALCAMVNIELYQYLNPLPAY